MENGLRERHKAARRERILDAARQLLRESPDAGVSMEQIAARAEVAPATVYNLLGPRDKLWEALAGAFMERLEPRLDATRSRDAVAHARAIVRTTVDLFIEDPVLSRRVLREWEASGLVLNRNPLDRLIAALEEAQKEGLLRSDVEVAPLAVAVSSACVGILHQWAAALIDGEHFRARAQLALDVALAAAAADSHRDRLLAPLRRSGGLHHL